MPSFKFSLEKVLTFELSKKVTIEKELSDVQEKINTITKDIDNLFCLLRKTNEALKDEYKKGTNTSTIIIHKAYLNNISNKIAAQKRELQKQEYFKREILLKLKNQNVEVKKLENFKKNKLDEHNKIETKKQERSLDEFIVSLRN